MLGESSIPFFWCMSDDKRISNDRPTSAFKITMQAVLHAMSVDQKFAAR